MPSRFIACFKDDEVDIGIGYGVKKAYRKGVIFKEDKR